MKIRNGFVSNSSSSSFIIAVKSELTEERLAELFSTELEALKNSPFKSIIDSFIECIFNNAEKISIEEFMKDNYVEDWKDEEMPDIVKKAIKNDMTLYYGDFSSSGNSAVESLLCDEDLNYESDEIIIEHFGGY